MNTEKLATKDQFPQWVEQVNSVLGKPSIVLTVEPGISSIELTQHHRFSSDQKSLTTFTIWRDPTDNHFGIDLRRTEQSDIFIHKAHIGLSEEEPELTFTTKDATQNNSGPQFCIDKDWNISIKP